MNERKAILVRLDTDLYTAIQQQAKREDRPLSRLVRTALTGYLDRTALAEYLQKVSDARTAKVN